MVRAILLVGLLTASASAGLLAFAPLGSSPAAEPASEPQLYLLGARETIPDLRPAVLPGPTPKEELAPPRPTAILPGVSPDPAFAPAPGPVRNVTPQGMTAGPTLTAPLVRVAPVTPEPPLQARDERLFNPLVTSAGVLKVREREINLAGVNAPHFEERCGEGATWPCGRMARAALRRFIRGRAIECAVPAGAEAIPDPASCSVAGVDLSRWLVAQGWAKQANSDLAALERQARDGKRGMWADVRPDFMTRALPGLQPVYFAAGVGPSSPDSAAPMRARLSGTP
jgi:endonuclease YncB( thermonuclease family)